jgi:D-glycero-D-manno-heptose 1,7-bisphosphate phosphatase
MLTMLDLHSIDTRWTLFLDRDGVINQDKPDSYIFNSSEFIFYDGVLNALNYFAKRFGHIVVVTNQRGVGRGLMTEASLRDIHDGMLKEIEAAKGRIDKIYYCITNDNEDPNRKPNPGMAFQAKKDFPEINFSRSLVIGNNMSDMQFGRNAGMHTVFLKTTIPDLTLPREDIDLAYWTLEDFAKALQLT